MRKKIGYLLITIILFAFFTAVYNSKRENYNRSIEFYNRSFSSIVNKINEGRGTKIYYNFNEKESYFYLSNYEGPKIHIGDIIRKNLNEIHIYRKKSNGEYIEIGIGKSLEPKKSYFEFFF